jgi:hypothetical protein
MFTDKLPKKKTKRIFDVVLNASRHRISRWSRVKARTCGLCYTNTARTANSLGSSRRARDGFFANRLFKRVS